MISQLFYAHFLFLKGFSEACFNNAYEMAMQADPRYGQHSFGYTSWMCVGECYAMKKQLNDLANDVSTQSWKKHSEFLGYRKAAKGIGLLSKVNMGVQECFDQRPATFLKYVLPCK